MSEQGNYNVLVEVKKTTIWLRKKDAEKPIDGIIKNQGVIMIENKIILIEDDKEIRGMINDYLSGEFEVTAFNDGMSAIQKITSYDEYALALIDLMLPDISGMEIIKIIRKVSKIPIIIITAKDNDIDKSLGLNLGADDYVVKPFSLIELTARIKANIRRARTYQALPNNSIIKIKDIEIDPHSHMVQRKKLCQKPSLRTGLVWRAWDASKTHWKISFSSLQRRKNEMTHLIKLELKKFGIAQNIIFMFAAILFSILFITISLWDSMTDPKQVKDTFESTYLVIGLLMSFIFLVYSSVLTAKLVIGEYNHRTITIMFSYPLNRIKLIASKLTIIMVYTAISMTIGYICCSSYIIFADKSFNMLEGTFQPSMLRTWIPMAITTVIICMVLSLWSFIIGMIRKSVPATIVTSLIVIVLRQVIITKNTTNQESIMQVILVAIVTVIATLLIFKRKVPV